MSGLIMLLVYILAICRFAWLAFYILQQFQPPEPIGKIARVVIVVVLVILLIYILLAAVGGGGISLPSVK